MQAVDPDQEVGLVVGGGIAHDEGVAAGLVVFQLALADGLIGRAEPKEGEVLVTVEARIGVDRGKVELVGAFPVGDHVGQVAPTESVVRTNAKVSAPRPPVRMS